MCRRFDSANLFILCGFSECIVTDVEADQGGLLGDPHTCFKIEKRPPGLPQRLKIVFTA